MLTSGIQPSRSSCKHLVALPTRNGSPNVKSRAEYSFAPHSQVVVGVALSVDTAAVAWFVLFTFWAYDGIPRNRARKMGARLEASRIGSSSLARYLICGHRHRAGRR